MYTVLLYHYGGPAEVEQYNYTQQHTSKLSLNAKLEFLLYDWSSFLDGLAKITDPGGIKATYKT